MSLHIMELRRFGPLEREIAVIGQGTWKVENQARASAIAALRPGLDLGMTHIDTAEMYGSGTPRKSSPRRSPAGATKSSWSPRSSPSMPPANGTIAACERSLARLRTDRLDCYLLHWRGEYPLEETIAAFEQLRRAGEDPLLGREQLRRARPRRGLADRRRGPSRSAIRCSTTCRSARSSTPCSRGARRTSVAVVAYSPFGHGDFPGPRTEGGRVLQEIATPARRDPAPGRAAVPGAAARALRDPQGLQPRARRRERGGRGSPADRRRASPGSTRPFRAALVPLSFRRYRINDHRRMCSRFSAETWHGPAIGGPGCRNAMPASPGAKPESESEEQCSKHEGIHAHPARNRQGPY